MIDNRIARLKQAINAATNDDARYAFGEKLRELGYLDLADFATGRPPVEHLQDMECLAGL